MGARNRRAKVYNIKKNFNIMYISCVCLVPEEDMEYPRRDYEQLGVTMWVLGTEPESTARAARVFNHQTISPTPKTEVSR